jgi:hypothetical protein
MLQDCCAAELIITALAYAPDIHHAAGGPISLLHDIASTTLADHPDALTWLTHQRFPLKFIERVDPLLSIAGGDRKHGG